MCRRRKPCLIFVTGVPGSGKSYFIRHSPDLRELPRVDIKDIYLKYPEACQFDGWKLAQDKMIETALELSKKCKSDVVCEAILYISTPSRTRLELELRRHKIMFVFTDLVVNFDTCMRRVEEDFEKASSIDYKEHAQAKQYYQKRVDILNSYHAKGLI